MRNALYSTLALLCGMATECPDAAAKAPAPSRILSKVVVEPSSALPTKNRENCRSRLAAC